MADGATPDLAPALIGLTRSEAEALLAARGLGPAEGPFPKVARPSAAAADSAPAGTGARASQGVPAPASGASTPAGPSTDASGPRSEPGEPVAPPRVVIRTAGPVRPGTEPRIVRARWQSTDAIELVYAGFLAGPVGGRDPEVRS